MIMIPTKEMLNAWFDETQAWLIKEDPSLAELCRAHFFAGVAAYTHLQSPGSDEWKRQHGFKTTEQ